MISKLLLPDFGCKKVRIHPFILFTPSLINFFTFNSWLIVKGLVSGFKNNYRHLLNSFAGKSFFPTFVAG